jgi:hypothetical protein
LRRRVPFQMTCVNPAAGRGAMAGQHRTWPG